MENNSFLTVEGKTKWYKKLPHAYVIMLSIVIFAVILTYIIPAGSFDREVVNGRTIVVANSFHYIDQTPVGLFDLFVSIPQGMVNAANVVFVTFFAAGMFKVFTSTGAIENGMGLLMSRSRAKKRSDAIIISILTFVFSVSGAVIGFENSIPFIPIAVIVALGLGYDILVGAAISIGGIGIGFSSSPLNPYTVGVSQSIAEMPMFSGFGLRAVYYVTAVMFLCFFILRYAKKIKADPQMSLVKGIDTEGLRLTKDLDSYAISGKDIAILAVFILFLLTVVFCVIKFKLSVVQLSALFLIFAIIAGTVAGYKPGMIADIMVKGASELTFGALIIGVAKAISIVLDAGHISDTIINSLSIPLQNVPVIISGPLMCFVHCLINFFIPSGSGQAMATMPIMLPLSDMIGLTRQTAILAFQIGDGVTNLIYPSLGALFAMLAMTRVPFEKWVKFIAPVVGSIILLGCVFIEIAIAINWGPF